MRIEDLERLFKEHGEMVLRRARQILRDDDDARDALQDIFLQLVAARFDGRSSPTTFLYGVTTHHCLNRLRNRRNRVRLIGEHGDAVPVPQHRASAEDAATVTGVLARMPEELAAVTVYYHLDEMSQQEIAELMACSRRQVGNLLERAQEWLEKDQRRVA